MYEISKPSLDDIESISLFLKESFRINYLELNEPKDFEMYLKDNFSTAKITAELNSPENIYLIAKNNKAIAGLIKFQQSTTPECLNGKKSIELQRLYIDPKYQNHGLGRTLLNRGLSEIKKQGHKSSWLGVWEKNQTAISIYRHWGLNEVGEHIFVMGTDPQRDLVFEIPLDRKY